MSNHAAPAATTALIVDANGTDLLVIAPMSHDLPDYDAFRDARTGRDVALNVALILEGRRRAGGIW